MSKPRNRSFAETFEDKLEQEARALGLFDMSVLVAVSGGPDSLALSTALARLRVRLNLTLTLVYVDHGLRGMRASCAERAAVARVAHRFAVPLRVVAIGADLARTKSGGDGLEARARQARYRELFSVARQRGAGGVCLAHHRNDQVETVLMRLLSGSTVEGLGGMRPVTERDGNTLYRPLLGLERSEILSYVAAMSLRPVHDRSNRDRTRLRSRIRTTVVPILTRTRPGALSAIARTADAIAEADRAVEWSLEHVPGHAEVEGAADDSNDLPGTERGARDTASTGIRFSRERFFSLPAEFRLRLLQAAVHEVSGSDDYRIPRRFFSPLLGSGGSPEARRRAVGHGVELAVDEDAVRVMPSGVLEGATRTPAGVQIADGTGALSRGRLPEPFSGISVAHAQPHTLLESPTPESGMLGSPLPESPVRESPLPHSDAETGALVTLNSLCMQCRPPVRLRPAKPNDGKAFGETRSGFKRRIERTPSSWAIIEDESGPVILLYAGPKVYAGRKDRIQSDGEKKYRVAQGRTVVPHADSAEAQRHKGLAETSEGQQIGRTETSTLILCISNNNFEGRSNRRQSSIWPRT